MSNVTKFKRRAAEFEQLRQFDKAAASYTRAIEEAEQNGEEVEVGLYNKVGDLMLRMGRTPEAVSYYERAVERYSATGLHTNAIALCNKILRNAPGRSGIYLTLGRICARKGLRGDASRNFLEYVTRMKSENRTDEAMRALAEIVDLMPELSEIRGMVEEYASRVGIQLGKESAQTPSAGGESKHSSDLIFLEIEPEPAKGSALEVTSWGAEPQGGERTDGIGHRTAARASGPTGGASGRHAMAPAGKGEPAGSGGKERSAGPLHQGQGTYGQGLPGHTVTGLPDRRVSHSEESGAPSSDDPFAGALIFDPLDSFDESDDDFQPVELTSDVGEASHWDSTSNDVESEEQVEDAGSGSVPASEAFVEVESASVESTPEPFTDAFSTPDSVLYPASDSENDELPESVDETTADKAADGDAGEMPGSIPGLIVTGHYSDPGVTPVQGLTDLEPDSPWELDAPVGTLESLTSRFDTPVTECPAGLCGNEDFVEAEGGARLSSDHPLVPDELGSRTVEEMRVAMQASSEPMRINPHHLILPGELPPLLIPDGMVPVGMTPVERGHTPGHDLPAADAIDAAIIDTTVTSAPGEVREDAFDGRDGFVLDDAIGWGGASQLDVAIEGDGASQLDGAIEVDDAIGVSGTLDLDDAIGVSDPIEPASTTDAAPDDGLEELIDVSSDIVIEGAAGAAPDIDVVPWPGIGSAYADDDVPDDDTTSVEAAADATIEAAADATGVASGDAAAALPDDPAAIAERKIAALASALEASPDDLVLQQRHAEALVELGRREEGITALERVLSAYETAGDRDAAYDIASQLVLVGGHRIRHHQKRVELAVRMDEPARLKESYLDLADTLVRMGEDARAHAVYARVLELDPRDERARLALGDAAPPLPGEPSPDEGYVDLASWLRDDDGSSTRIRMHTPEITGDEQADFDSLLRHFRDGVARSIGEDDHDSHYDLGVAYKEMGLLDDAIAEFQKALRSRVHRLAAYEALGQCFLEQGNNQVAITVLSRALHEPGLGDQQRIGVLYLLGYALTLLQRTEEARGYFQRVYAIDKHFRDVAARLAAIDQVTQ